MKRVTKKTDVSTASTSLGDQSSAAGTAGEVELREAMQEYFDANDKCEVLYVASDGEPFYELHFAENYQRSLDKNKEVVIINR